MINRDSLIRIISDFHECPIPGFCDRPIPDFVIRHQPRKIISLIGPRRSGKSTLLWQMIRDLQTRGIDRTSFLLINFEDERLDAIKAEELGTILDIYYELYPRKVNSPVFVFLDEIQAVEGWEKFVRRLHDQHHVSVTITGSSAKLLSKEIATALRGRSLSHEVFPFSFTEFLDYRKIERKSGSTRQNAFIKNALGEYFRRGGFPEVLDYDKVAWQFTLQEYFQVMMFRDVIERHGLKNHDSIKYILKHCLRNFASPLSINKLFNDLKSQGIPLGKESLYEYLSFFKDAYLIDLIPIFSSSLRAQRVNYRKLYSIDHGLSLSLGTQFNEKRGACLENMVFYQLRRKKQNEIFYYKTKSGGEVDFVVLQNDKVNSLIQVCYDLAEDQTKRREIPALLEAMKELNCSQSYLITSDRKEVIKQGKSTITVSPFSQWAQQGE